MDDNWRQKLMADFPKLFRQRHLSMRETCMCWGIETGPGWEKLLRRLCEQLAAKCPDVEALQVKEKFGCLRFYITGGNEEASRLIEDAERESGETCEHCGSTEDVGQTSGWISTECRSCAEKRGDMGAWVPNKESRA